MGYPQSEWPGGEVCLSPCLVSCVKGSILAVCAAERAWAHPPKLREKDEPPPRSPTDANRWVSPPRDCLCRWRQCGSAGGRRARATCPTFGIFHSIRRCLLRFIRWKFFEEQVVVECQHSTNERKPSGSVPKRTHSSIFEEKPLPHPRTFREKLITISI